MYLLPFNRSTDRYLSSLLKLTLILLCLKNAIDVVLERVYLIHLYSLCLKIAGRSQTIAIH